MDLKRHAERARYFSRNFAFPPRFRSNVERPRSSRNSVGKKGSAMEPRAANSLAPSVSMHPTRDGCDHEPAERRMKRRDFLTTTGGLALGATALGSMLPSGRVWAQVKDSAAT